MTNFYQQTINVMMMMQSQSLTKKLMMK